MKNKQIIIPQTYIDCHKNLYCTLGMSKPVQMNDSIKYKNKNITFETATCGLFKYINVYYTEDINPHICVWFDKDKNKYYHLKRVNENDLILYKALYDDGDKGIYIQGMNKFLSCMNIYNTRQVI